MSKLNLSEITSLALKNHFTLELVPGATEKSYRFHCLVTYPNVPALLISLGDETHGYLFDSCWVKALNGKLRVKEADVRKLLESPAHVKRWNREILDAENTIFAPVTVLNPDLALIRLEGTVTSYLTEGILVTPSIGNVLPLLVLTDERPQPGSFVTITGTYSLLGHVTAVEFLNIK